jgi:hypothetical protein
MRKLFYIIFIFSFFNFESLAQNYRETSFDDRPFCEKQKGLWRDFGDSCVDGCLAKLDSLTMCARAITAGCDCGENRCWDGNSCVNLSDYKKIYDAKKAEEQIVLDKAKKEREGARKQYQQSLLDKISGTVSNTTSSAQKIIGDAFDDTKQAISGGDKPNQNQQNNNIVTQVEPQNQAQINAQKQASSPPMNSEIPPYFLQKQKQQEEAAKKDPLAMDNLEGQALNAAVDSMIPQLPDIPVEQTKKK